MAAGVKTLIPARPVEQLLSTNIPFLDRNNPDGYLTHFQKEFQPWPFCKAEPVCQPNRTQVDQKKWRQNTLYLTEAMASYQHHPLPQITRTPRWTKLYTNFQMQTDPREVASFTTEFQNYKPRPFQPPPTLIRPPQGIKKIQQVEKHPESINKATFTPHHGSPVVKATVKHLEEGFPTIKGDKRHCSFVSQHNNTFQGSWGRAAQPVHKHCSSVALGDGVKIVERETSYTASFRQPTFCRYTPVVKEHLKINFGNFSKDSWSSTSKETFSYHKPVGPVVLTKRNENASSLPRGDTDPRRNKERMSVTTNRMSFTDLNHRERPVFVPGANRMTKSNVEFSPPCLSALYYTTTAKEHYSKKDGERATPAVQLLSNILSGPEPSVSLSTTKADFVPLKTYRKTSCMTRQRSNIRFPLAEQHFRTTHTEDYKPKPLLLQPPSHSHFITHFDMK